MGKFFQKILLLGIVIICLLLFANLYIEYQILKRMPPTLEEIRNADSNQRKALLLKQPVVHCNQ